MTFSSHSIPNTAKAGRTTFPRGQILAVVFDAVGTVMYTDPSVAAAYRRAIAQHCGVDISEEVVNTTVRNSLRQRSVVSDLRTDEAAEDEFWATLIRDFCPQSDGFQSCFDDLFAHFGDAQNWRCFPDVPSTMSRLRHAGLQLAVASNFDRRLNSVCDGLSELGCVRHRIISSVVGWRKPAPQFFEAVTKCLKLPPARILMVGDDLTNDVAGAQAAGLQVAWICRDESLCAELPAGAVRISTLEELPGLLQIDEDSHASIQTERRRV